MTTVIINPGTGPVAKSNLQQAWKNIRQFRRDLADDKIVTKNELPPAIPERISIKAARSWEGRYDFILRCGKRRCEVSMPGIDLERVRYLGAADQNAWHYPRLYVDGSSWLWEFALSTARRELAQPLKLDPEYIREIIAEARGGAFKDLPPHQFASQVVAILSKGNPE